MNWLLHIPLGAAVLTGLATIVLGVMLVRRNTSRSRLMIGTGGVVIFVFAVGFGYAVFSTLCGVRWTAWMTTNGLCRELAHSTRGDVAAAELVLRIRSQRPGDDALKTVAQAICSISTTNESYNRVLLKRELYFARALAGPCAEAYLSNAVDAELRARKTATKASGLPIEMRIKRQWGYYGLDVAVRPDRVTVHCENVGNELVGNWSGARVRHNVGWNTFACETEPLDAVGVRLQGNGLRIENVFPVAGMGSCRLRAPLEVSVYLSGKTGKEEELRYRFAIPLESNVCIVQAQDGPLVQPWMSGLDPTVVHYNWHPGLSLNSSDERNWWIGFPNALVRSEGGYLAGTIVIGKSPCSVAFSVQATVGARVFALGTIQQTHGETSGWQFRLPGNVDLSSGGVLELIPDVQLAERAVLGQAIWGRPVRVPLPTRVETESEIE